MLARESVCLLRALSLGNQGRDNLSTKKCGVTSAWADDECSNDDTSIVTEPCVVAIPSETLKANDKPVSLFRIVTECLSSHAEQADI